MAAPQTLIVGWPGTNAAIPAGWVRVAAYDDRYPKASATPNVNAGAATHTHTPVAGHTHNLTHQHAMTTGAGGSLLSTGIGSGSGPNHNVSTEGGHSDHTTTNLSRTASTDSTTPGASSSGTNDLSRYTVIWIQSQGTNDIPATAIMWWNATAAPNNHYICNGQNGTPDLRAYFLKGAAAGGDGGTRTTEGAHTHTDAHTHGVAAHTHAPSGSSGPHAGSYEVLGEWQPGNPSPNGGIERPHTHPLNGTSASGSGTTASDSTASSSATSEPVWYKLHHIQKSGASAEIPTGIIGLWTGTLGQIPSGWGPCDGTAGTPNLNGGGYFVKGAWDDTERGTTGGGGHSHSTSHDHGSGTHGHAAGTLAMGSVAEPFIGTVAVGAPDTGLDHTHALTVANATGTSSAGSIALPSTTTDPLNRTAIFIQSMPLGKSDTDSFAANLSEVELFSVGVNDSEDFSLGYDETASVRALEITITNPSADEVITQGDPTVTWTLTGGDQQSYRVRIALDAAGSTVVYDTGMIPSGSLERLIPGGVLQNNGDYWVWVHAIATDGMEAISDLQHFTTAFGTSVDISGLSVAVFGDRCRTPAEVPHVRLRWTQVVPGAGETFLSYDVYRKEQTAIAWTRVAVIDDVTVTHYEDYAIRSGAFYNYAVVWEANTAGGVLVSSFPPSPPIYSVTYDWAFLHEVGAPTDGISLDSFDISVDPQQDIAFARAWGRTQRTAFVGEGYDHVIQLRMLPRQRRGPDVRATWSRLDALLARQATSGSVLCLRLGMDGELYWVAASRARASRDQMQWEGDVTLQEVFFEEAV